MKRYVALVVAALAMAGCSGRGAAPASEPAPNPAAFKGLGKLAYLRDGKLHILDGDKGQERQVTIAGQASAPAWSPDGRWLAFLWRSGDTGASELHVAGGDGSGEHPIQGLPTVSAFAWAPNADVIAAAAGEGGLWVTAPESGGSAQSGGAARLVAPDEGNGFFAWSPDGRQLAYTSMVPAKAPPPTDLLWTVSVAGGPPRRLLTDARNGIAVAGWQPDGKGLLYWLMPAHSASLSADGVALTLLPLENGAAQSLTTMLMRRDWLSWAPDGRRLLVTVGGGRMAWTGKALAVCRVATAACQALDQPLGSISQDGVWSPTGERIAFVRGAELGGEGRPEQWVASRSLWVSAPDGTGARELTAAGKGVSAPRWSKDGRHLVYARENALWLIDAEGGAPAKLTGPLLTVGTADSYYGHLPAPAVWYQS